MSLSLASILTSTTGYIDPTTNGWTSNFPIDHEAVQALLCMMGAVTTVLWACTFSLNKTICALFFFLALAFFLLAGGVKNEKVEVAGGWAGFAAAILAFWLGTIELVNDVVGGGKEILCPGHWTRAAVDRHHGAFHAAGRIHAPLAHSALHWAGFDDEVHHRLIHPSSVTPEASAQRCDTDAQEAGTPLEKAR